MAGEHIREFRVSGQVDQLVRVGVQVIELLGGPGAHEARPLAGVNVPASRSRRIATKVGLRTASAGGVRGLPVSSFLMYLNRSDRAARPCDGVVVPVPLGEDEVPDLHRRVLEERREVLALDARPRLDTGQLQDRGGDVDRADQAAATAAGPDVARPPDEERRPDPAVVQRRLAARERAAVITKEQDQRVSGDPLTIEFREHVADVAVERG